MAKYVSELTKSKIKTEVGLTPCLNGWKKLQNNLELDRLVIVAKLSKILQKTYLLFEADPEIQNEVTQNSTVICS